MMMLCGVNSVNLLCNDTMARLVFKFNISPAAPDMSRPWDIILYSLASIKVASAPSLSGFELSSAIATSNPTAYSYFHHASLSLDDISTATAEISKP